MKIRRDPLDALMSEYVRKRGIQRVGGCERCLKQCHDIVKDDGTIYPAWKQLQCCHFHPRRNMSVRFDPDNTQALCFGCHQHFHENHEEHKAFTKRLLGEERYSFLEGRMRQKGKPDRKAIKIWLQIELAKLAKGGDS